MPKASEGIAPVVAVNRRGETPLHKQIYDGFRTAILLGNLRPGQRVPSSRSLGLDLKVSRLPVLHAYGQLMAEGYFESRAGAGTFVAESLPESLTTCESAMQQVPSVASGPRPVARRSEILPEYRRPLWSVGWGAFGVHQPAFDHFPFSIWSKLLSRHSQSPRLSAIHNVDPLGSAIFREAICEYLRTSRAVRCDPSQVMVVSGSQQALDITARVLLEKGSGVWMEEPGYWLARKAFAGVGCRLQPVPVDEDGLIVPAGIDRFPDARAAYVTPSHQYPLGATLSATRRIELLNWAHRAGSWIIEDDYDSEYRFDCPPISSLQGLDGNNRVIYIGTFSKVLFPSLRLGYLVIPRDLVGHFCAVRSSMDIFPPYLHQEVITDFMREGHFARHIRKMRLLYGERRSALVASLHQYLGTRVRLHGAPAGMHLAVTLSEDFSDLEIATRAAENGLWLWPLSPSYLDKPARQGLILGFGSTSVEEMPRAVSQLCAFLEPHS